MKRRRRAKFNMSHVNSTTGKMGFLIPIMLQETYPGDTWQGDSKLFIRVFPLLAPLMHEVDVQVATYHVEDRIMLPKFTEFITGGSNGEDATVLPTVSVSPTVGSLADYFGLPLCDNELTVSAFPFRAYNMIYNHFYRDQDLQDEVAVSTDPGPDDTTSLNLLRGNWMKDYFTTARPWPQKGDAINIPLGVSAPVLSNDGTYSNPVHFIMDNMDKQIITGSGDNLRFLGLKGDGTPAANSEVYYPRELNFIADLSNASTITVDELRQAFAYQRMSEARSITGSRYEDLLHAWGLTIQDYRLDKPELVSVRRTKLQFSEVLQTTPDASGAGVGNMAGHGIGALRSGRWRYYVHQHGWLMTLLIIRPKAVYTQGVERHWSRKTRYDYWNPELQHIGQQEVLNKEIFADGTSADEEVFGYQNRYDELRRGKNHVTGEFRTTLDFWHMARIFENRPNLNSEFITSNPTDRVYQLSEDLSDQLLIMVRNDLLAKRLMSRVGRPI